MKVAAEEEKKRRRMSFGLPAPATNEAARRGQQSATDVRWADLVLGRRCDGACAHFRDRRSRGGGHHPVCHSPFSDLRILTGRASLGATSCYVTECVLSSSKVVRRFSVHPMQGIFARLVEPALIVTLWLHRRANESKATPTSSSCVKASPSSSPSSQSSSPASPHSPRNTATFPRLDSPTSSPHN